MDKINSILNGSIFFGIQIKHDTAFSQTETPNNFLFGNDQLKIFTNSFYST